MSGEQRRTPDRFWRVQHTNSHTLYDTDDGFNSQVHFYMDYSHRINKDMVERQLDWRNREPTGLISVFASLDAARKRRDYLIERSYQHVVLVSISTATLQDETLRIRFLDGILNLRVHRNDSTLFFSTSEAVMTLGIRSNWAMSEEWFA